jgi:hypothetical protein
MDRRWRLTVYDDAEPLGELYDLEGDPDERVNLFDDPGRRDLRHGLVEQLLSRVIALSETSPLATHHGP